VYSGTSSKHVDEGAQSSRHVAAVGMIKAEPRRRWHPVIQYGDEVTTRQVGSDARLPHICEASIGQRRVLDLFYLSAWVCVALIPLCFLVRRPASRPPPVAAE
jgi:hypothetical protein